MSHDVRGGTINKLTHSSSDDNILLNPISKILHHSNPPSYGSRQKSFDAEDMNASNDYIVSSPYQNASSALAVLDVLPLHFGVVPETMRNQKHLPTSSISDQQATVGYTKDLSLPINFLPGEDDIKLQEDVVYSCSNRKIIYPGELIITKYRLLFLTKPSNSIEILVNIPIGMISEMKKIGRQTLTKNDSALYGIEITSKDYQNFFFGSAKEQHQRRNLFENLTRLIFPFANSVVDITNPVQFFSKFFAWNYKKAFSPNEIDVGWTLYDKIKDYTRMGLQQDAHWTINTEINKNYILCDTYPDILVIPKNFDPLRLPNVAAFRSRNRLPTLSWFSHETHVTITRSSQPLTGLNRKCQDDMDYLHEIFKTNINQNSKFFILDARPKLNALANKANGRGYENYSDCELEFHNIHNIHVMRESLHKLYSTIRHKTTNNDFENYNWLTHIRAILISTNRLVSLVYYDKRSVLVHCSDGWDRTSQLTSLAMLMLDPFYRTLNGYMILIEKEWISFGHKFFLRIGHGNRIHPERSPIFLQFLDCTYQLLQQFENAFEFNEKLLLKIAEDLYSCQYGTFLLNSEKNRKDMNISKYTMSAWTSIIHERQIYLNPMYNENIKQISQIDTSVNYIKLWKNYYYQHIPDYQSTLNCVHHRTSTLLHLRTKFTHELHSIRPDEQFSQTKSRPSSFILSGTQTTSQN